MASLSSSRRGLPRRQQPVSSMRRATRAVLIAGTVVALGAAFGPLWAVRIGLVTAIAAALVAVLLAWRELSAERSDHAQAMATASRAHGEQLHAEREQNAAVMETLSARSQALTVRIETQQRHTTQLRAELAAVRGARSKLTVDLARRDNQIGALRRTVKEQTAQIDELRGQLAEAVEAAEAAVPQLDAEVHVLPRRVRIDDSGEAADRELSDVRPRSFQLSAADPILMPNYEGELRLA